MPYLSIQFEFGENSHYVNFRGTIDFFSERKIVFFENPRIKGEASSLIDLAVLSTFSRSILWPPSRMKMQKALISVTDLLFYWFVMPGTSWFSCSRSVSLFFLNCHSLQTGFCTRPN